MLTELVSNKILLAARIRTMAQYEQGYAIYLDVGESEMGLFYYSGGVG